MKRSRGTASACHGGFNNHLAAFGLMGTVIRRNWSMWNLSARPGASPKKHMLVGPLCTTIDTLAQDVELPDPRDQRRRRSGSVRRLRPLCQSDSFHQPPGAERNSRAHLGSWRLCLRGRQRISLATEWSSRSAFTIVRCSSRSGRLRLARTQRGRPNCDRPGERTLTFGEWLHAAGAFAHWYRRSAGGPRWPRAAVDGFVAGDGDRHRRPVEGRSHRRPDRSQVEGRSVRTRRAHSVSGRNRLRRSVGHTEPRPWSSDRRLLFDRCSDALGYRPGGAFGSADGPGLDRIHIRFHWTPKGRHPESWKSDQSVRRRNRLSRSVRG